MNFVLVENNNIIVGPNEWNQRRFQSVLLDDLGISASLPLNNFSVLTITNTVIFYPSTIIEPDNFNTKIHQYAGPTWTFSDSRAIGTYTAVDQDINEVKINLKNTVADNRYNAEVNGTTATIQDKVVFLDTSRDGRNIFVQQFLLMSDTDTVEWKFPNNWMILTKSDLQTLVLTGVTHIQGRFVWEATKVLEIDACTSLTELDAVILTE